MQRAPRLVAAALAAGLLMWSAAVAAQQFPPSRAEPAQRVVIQFTGGSFSLLQQIDLRSVLPPSDALPATENGKGLSGFWFEVLSPTGAVRYRRIVENPVMDRFEGPEAGPGGEPPADAEGTRPVRDEEVPAERVFSLLIPAPAQGDQLVIFSSPIEPGQGFRAATEVARFDLAGIVIP